MGPGFDLWIPLQLWGSSNPPYSSVLLSLVWASKHPLGKPGHSPLWLLALSWLGDFIIPYDLVSNFISLKKSIHLFLIFYSSFLKTMLIKAVLLFSFYQWETKAEKNYITSLTSGRLRIWDLSLGNLIPELVFLTSKLHCFPRKKRYSRKKNPQALILRHT